MISNDASTALPADQVIVRHAPLIAKHPLATGTLFRVKMPFIPNSTPAGQFFLARPCNNDLLSRQYEWHNYIRRPLYVADQLPHSTSSSELPESIWTLYLQTNPQKMRDPGDTWLARQPLDTVLNLTGPFGQPIQLQKTQSALVVATDTDHLPICLPIVQFVLDLGGRAVVILQQENTPTAAALQRIPRSVEVQATADDSDSATQLVASLQWADALVVALPHLSPNWLSQSIQMKRFRLEPTFAHYFVSASYGCGYGACLACSVTAGNGFSRACQHGPFFPLESLL